MQILHKINDFLFTIFPTINKEDKKSLISTIQEYYTYGSYRPKVTIEDNWVKIEIDTSSIISQGAEYKKVLSLCEKGKYSEAKPILKSLIDKNPTISEYHRIMGQILSDEGNQEEAINCLIDALRWDSKNGWALLMMGNIFAKFKADIPTAMKYYDQALVANPNDNITINNIGANLLQQGKLQEAKKYFSEAIRIDEQYPNTHFALAMIAEKEEDWQPAFHSAIQAIRYNRNKDVLHQNSIKLAFETAQKIIDSDIGNKIFSEYRHKLEFEGDRSIDVIRDAEIPTAAKFEFAENYQRDIHVVRYKPSYPAVQHLIMHELAHLDLVIQARKDDLNQLFISNQSHKSQFITGLESSIKKFKQMGISEKSIVDYCTSLFEGMNRQIFNAPIDLFIEDYLHGQFPDLRPYQFISLYTLIKESLKTVTDPEIVELSPKDILSKSKVYNLVGAIQFKELFGLDFIKEFNATPSELKYASDFYDEYLEYKDDKAPGEEYELVIHWAQDLKLEKYFELVNETEFRTKRASLDSHLSAIEKDPFGLASKDLHKEREIELFQKSHESNGTNMVVTLYMVEAIEFFQGWTKEEIKETAFEIALLGTQGFSPDKDNYRINSLPDRKFSGYQILAFYYVSWALAIPEMLSQLQLPFDDEYKLALSMQNPNQ